MSSQLVSQIISEKQTSYNDLSKKRILWDNAEKLFHNQLNDLNSAEAGSQVFDPKLTTLTIERGYRVMSKLGVGKVKGVSSNDVGDAKLKNLLLDKYVVPNANAQFDFLTKLRMVDIYSNLYGNFFVLIDQDVKPNGYIGPDMWLLNIRDVFPQVGAVSLDDSDQIIIRTWKPITYFENLKPNQGFKNVGAIVTKLKGMSGSKQNRDLSNMGRREMDQYNHGQPIKGKGYFEVLTRFERDRWVDICVDADMDFRDQANPHDNGELPVECKYSIPLLDDFMGMGDFERGGSMQMVVNSSWNLYLDAVKMSIFPPVIINKDNVASMSSIQPIPGAQWLGRNNVGNVAQPINLSPQGINTFNNTLQAANGSINNLFGTTDTTSSIQQDQAMGKTPQALQLQNQRENTRDNADRFYMEQFVTKVMKRMVNLMNKKQANAIQFRMFPEEIELLAKDYPDINKMYNDKTGQLSVKKGDSSTLYDYEIVSGSTYAIDQAQQQQNLQQLMELYLKSNVPPFGNVLQNQLQSEGLKLDFGELFKRVVSSMNIDSWEKILVDMSMQEKADVVMTKHAAHLNNVLQQSHNMNMSSIPPTPQVPQSMAGQQQMPHGPVNIKGMLDERVTMNYKDLPPDIQRQAESDAGFQPSQVGVPPQGPTPPQMPSPGQIPPGVLSQIR